MQYSTDMVQKIFNLTRVRFSYRQLFLLSLLTFLFGIIYGLFSFYLPVFTENAVKNVALVGVLLALVEIMGILIDLPVGAFADRYGRRKTIFWERSYFFSRLYFSRLAFLPRSETRFWSR